MSKLIEVDSFGSAVDPEWITSSVQYSTIEQFMATGGFRSVLRTDRVYVSGKRVRTLSELKDAYYA